MEKNILKIDLDLRFKFQAIKLLKERLSYMHDIGLYNVSEVEKIELIHKTSYACKMYLKTPLFDEKNIIIFQLLLGSDFMKEINTMLNHFKFKMDFSNRMFDCKRYKGGKIRVGKIYDVTDKILKFVLVDNRKKYRN